MRDYQKEFLDFAIEIGVLRFGQFTLKSGRQSPYFFNSGLFNTGASLARLGRYYAAAIDAADLEFDLLFGPAYKGIPLVASIAIALADGYKRDLPYSFNRKEAKDHGEGGTLVGAALQGRVLIVDDVISAGTSAREAIELIRQAGADLAGMVVSLDRQERGRGATSAIQEMEQAFGMRVHSIVNLADLIQYLAAQPDRQQELVAIREYQAEYGVS